MEWQKIVLVGLLALVIMMAGFVAFQSFGKLAFTEQNYQNALAAEQADKCATPSGYTDEEWREHMGHHPDRYKECLS